ncbi:MAG: AAA family ATPase [Deltaproteobacteria bacterium]|nr:AAA family ATPase [Deltaproteobacteria bacterium]
MDKQFHIFVRQCAGVGWQAEVLGAPELVAFASTLDLARADLARTLSQRLMVDEAFEQTEFALREAKLRRMEVTVSAVQATRLLRVPLRVSVVLHALDETKARPDEVGVRIPRLGVVQRLAHAHDVEAFVEALVSQQLFMADAADLARLAYMGDETLEALSVTYRKRPAPIGKSKRPSASESALGVLRETTRDLVSEARAQTLDRAFSRDETLTTLVEVLTRASRASVLLLGPRGVGKSAVVSELAYRMAEATPESVLHGMQLVSTSGHRIIAGMRYLGQWQARLQRMLDVLATQRAVLHIDSLANLLTGASSDGGMDLGAYLLPAIERGAIVLLCEATDDERAQIERTHPALLRALRAVPLAPLEGRAARTALESIATRIGRTQRMRFGEGSLQCVSELCERFGDGSAMPGAAVALLRSTAARCATRATPVQVDDVLTAFVERTGYPRALVDPSIVLDPEAVLTRLRERVVGQESALRLMRDLTVTLKTAMTDPSRPLGSYLFVGPTGVGKTECALALASYLFGDEQRVVRFDMGEYSAPGSAARLVSTDAGAQGSLVTKLREQPFAVLLLDEIEKADGTVHDLLLQLLGEGRISDGMGRTVSARNTVVILTSNLGAESLSRTVGFATQTRRDAATHYQSEAARFFRPELLNRIDHVVPFEALDVHSVSEIAERALRAALRREGLSRRGIRVRYEPALIARLTALGFDPRYGARPMKRAIEQWVIGPIARVLAARGASAPTTLELVVRDDEVRIAPTSTHEVHALSDSDALDELKRRTQQRDHGWVTLTLDTLDEAPGLHAQWLCDRYAALADALASRCEVEMAAGFTLRMDGAAGAALRLEQGVHEFETPAGAVRVRVTCDALYGAASDSLRLYTAIPTEAVWDVATDLAWDSAWQQAMDTAGLARFVLARMIHE